jgi:dTDP-4-dehydrorhamnose 3,5-epimerase-like enzyme
VSEGPPLPGGCYWVEFRKFSDDRGALTPIEFGHELPFTVKRAFYFYDVPVGERRGSHAHRSTEQILIAISGSFQVMLEDNVSVTTITCDRPWRGLYMPPLVWAEQTNFTGGTVGLVLASAPFDEADYVRDKHEFNSLVGKA